MEESSPAISTRDLSLIKRKVGAGCCASMGWCESTTQSTLMRKADCCSTAFVAHEPCTAMSLPADDGACTVQHSSCPLGYCLGLKLSCSVHHPHLGASQHIGLEMVRRMCHSCAVSLLQKLKSGKCSMSTTVHLLVCSNFSGTTQMYLQTVQRHLGQ